MVTKPNLDCFDEFTASFIRSKVRQLIGKAGLTKSDYPDLIQEFVLDLIQRSRKFNLAQANWQAFVVVVCENRFASILEHRQAEMRSSNREVGSLNQSMNGAKGKETEYGATIPDSQQGFRTGQYHKRHDEISDLVQDIDYMLDHLPPHLRKLCERLKEESISSVARDMSISRATLYEWISGIRTRFEKSGLREYLQ